MFVEIRRSTVLVASTRCGCGRKIPRAGQLYSVRRTNGGIGSTIMCSNCVAMLVSVMHGGPSVQLELPESQTDPFKRELGVA